MDFAGVDDLKPIRMDRWNRYVLPDPDTGKEIPWTRVTTFAGAVADTWGIRGWEQRMTAKGIAMRTDLRTLAMATPMDDNKENKKAWTGIVERAKEAAGASEKSNLGTAIHKITEQVDRGETVDVPDEFKADIVAYQEELKRKSMRILPEYLERVVIVPEYSLAGRLDKILEWAGQNFIGDVKTGHSVHYAWGEIAIQLSCYANAAAVWNQATQEYESLPDLNKEIAAVIHAPVGTGTCEVHSVDIAAGWEMLKTCRIVRQWRNRKDLADAWPSAPLPTPSPAKLLESRHEFWARKLYLCDSTDGLGEVWKAASARGEWTPELEAIGKQVQGFILSGGGRHEVDGE